MIALALVPLQPGLGVVFGLLPVILPLVAFYFLWSIWKNTRQIAADVERIREAAEDQEPNKRR